MVLLLLIHVLILLLPLASFGHLSTHHQISAKHREAAVHGMGSVSQLRALRRQAAAAGLNPRPKLVGPKPKVAEGPSWDKRLQAWTLPFPGESGSNTRF